MFSHPRSPSRSCSVDLFPHPRSPFNLFSGSDRVPCISSDRDHEMRRLRRINSWAPPHPNASTPAPLAKHTMAPPSSFVISGIFSLSEGIRSTEQRHYVDYLSAIDFIDPDDFLNVSVRKYTTLAEPLHEHQKTWRSTIFELTGSYWRITRNKPSYVV